ncbi:MAG: hypothetical protein JXR25_05920 [Pontiellaceae bacterium]|nr:hypothetical protein [Pontiellaceae bacterium]MBN2784345.1 hypothetical protein [Pontiellaceae bacterium]
MKTKMVMAALLAGMTVAAQASLLVSNWELTDTTLSYDLTGTLDASFVGPEEQRYIFVGELGNSSWLNTSFASGEWVDNGSVLASSVSAVYMWNGGSDGDMVYTRCDNWTTGDQLDLTISYTGSFNPEAVNASNLGVFWGQAGSSWLQPENQVGSAIPEPATLAFVGIFGAGTLAVRRIFMM